MRVKTLKIGLSWLMLNIPSAISTAIEDPFGTSTFKSGACCGRPPVIMRGGYNYSPVGKSEPYNGTSTYVTGPKEATRGVIMIYDIFGMFIQTIRGADIMAYGYEPASDEAGKFKVFMPDFFGEEPANLLDYPPKTPIQIKTINEYLTERADPAEIAPRVPYIMAAIQKAHPEIKTWALLGFCWGAKIAALNSQEGSQFKASAMCHPSLLDLADSTKVRIPMVVLPSLDEEPAIVDKWTENLKKVSPQSYNETFLTSVHGWMTSRAEFEQKPQFEEYIRGYKIVRAFFDCFL